MTFNNYRDSATVTLKREFVSIGLNIINEEDWLRKCGYSIHRFYMGSQGYHMPESFKSQINDIS